MVSFWNPGLEYINGDSYHTILSAALLRLKTFVNELSVLLSLNELTCLGELSILMLLNIHFYKELSLFVYDVNLIGSDIKTIERNAKVLNACKDIGLAANTGKTKYEETGHHQGWLQMRISG